ncbi:tetratricopeptide repeat protein [Streptomyces sp. NPDC058067]|uniref:tetratricopeptide repeat protein n=1 Tax=Streptomyces sp. NPDC058067 TaxID=3346324 RepID=UPI0036EB995A
MVKAAAVPPRAPAGRDVPVFPAIRRSTLYGYLKESDDRVGNGDWQVIDNLLRCIAFVAEANGKRLTIDYGSWQSAWQRLVDQKAARRPSIPAGCWIGSWDGQADAVLAQSSAQEFTDWPPGQSRLDLLSQAVARLGSAYEPQLAKEAAERLVAGATAELGEASAKTLAARHALAYWTGHSGSVRDALALTSSLRADCRAHLGDDHVLSRLAALREALWTGYTGRWHEANRLYVEAARTEANRADRDPGTWLLARWGMARSGGRKGNWTHAYVELGELLPSVTEHFGPDHPASLDAGHAYAWSAGRAGRAQEASALLEGLADQADSVLGPAHPASLRLRISLAHWTRVAGEVDRSLPMAAAINRQCETLLGRDHHLTIHAAEVEALCLLESDQDAALTALSDVAARTELNFGATHPQTLQAASNHAAARAVVEGPEPVLPVFKDLARRMSQALGDEHPDTLRIRMNVVVATLDTKGARAAQRLCEQTVASLRRALGDDHPETLAGRELLATIATWTRPASKPKNQRPEPSSWSDSGYSSSSDPGGGSASDRALKCRITPVSWPSGPETTHHVPIPPGDDPNPTLTQRDGFAILQAVASMPVSRWSYRGEEHVQHLGPMAQDWHAAFGLGPDDRSIHLVDVNGVSMVAVQALYRMVQSLQSEVSELRARFNDAAPAETDRDLPADPPPGARRP